MQRYFAKNIDDKKVELELSDYHHIKNVMRMKDNDKIEIVYDDVLYIAKIINVTCGNIEIIEKKDINNELEVEVSIAIGLVKEQKMDFILQKLTELGVSNIIPVKFSRSIVKLDEKSINKKLIRWRSICKEASEQSKRNKIPNISKPISIKELGNIDSNVRLVASTKNDVKLVSSYLQKDNKCDKILVVIGPEGGISEEEENYLNELGFKSVSFGNRILRVETAAIYIMSVISYSRM